MPCPATTIAQETAVSLTTKICCHPCVVRQPRASALSVEVPGFIDRFRAHWRTITPGPVTDCRSATSLEIKQASKRSGKGGLWPLIPDVVELHTVHGCTTPSHMYSVSVSSVFTG